MLQSIIRSIRNWRPVSIFALAVSLILGNFIFPKIARAEATVQLAELQIIKLPDAPNFIGDWQIGNQRRRELIAFRTVHVTDKTIIKIDDGAKIAIGSYVDVTGTVDDNFLGSPITATLIEVKNGPPVLPLALAGTIQQLPATTNFIGDWQVAQYVPPGMGLPSRLFTVHVTDKTAINVESGAKIAVGSFVEISGTIPDINGTLTATQITVKSAPPPVILFFFATIQSLPNTPNLIGDWKVNLSPFASGLTLSSAQNVTVHVSGQTVIKQDPNNPYKVGAQIQIQGTLGSDGSIDANSIAPSSGLPQACYDFMGFIEKLPSTSDFTGDWTVLGRTVHVTSSTQIVKNNGTIAVGARVEVSGCNASDGSFNATRIELLPPFNQTPPSFDFYGVIESLPLTANFIGNWTISHRTVVVNSSTTINTEQGSVKIGAFVRAKVSLQTDGTLLASSIEVLKQPPVIVPPTPPQFVFFGAVQSLPSASNFVGDWNVAGRTVHVSATTKIDQNFRPLVVGAFVMVAGTINADGSITATLVRVERSTDTGKLVNFFEFNGTVEALPSGTTLVGNWKVSGQTVVVSTTTKIIQPANNAVQVGSRVSITGVLNANNTLQADRIFVLKEIQTAQNFVTQNYRDFLNREPDDAGLNFWTNEIVMCGSDAACVDRKRVNTSGAFFLSTEFQQTGYFVYRFYKASFGRMPRLAEFLPDTQAVGAGVIVNQDGWQDKLAANKLAFAEDWVAHPAFAAIYDAMTDSQFVDALFANAGVTPSASARNALINGLATGAETRASVLMKIVEDQSFYAQEFNRAFVLMQYFGYLRRNPDDSPDGNWDGFNFWLNKLNEAGGDYIKAQMVRSFILSDEYNARFNQ